MSNDNEASGSGSKPGPKRTTVQHQQLPPRPKLVPSYPSAETRTPPTSFTHDDDDSDYLPYSLSGLTPTGGGSEGWSSIITAPAYAPLNSWQTVMQNLIRHPERNSSNILRADILSETQATNTSVEGEGVKQWTIKRALLPRRPNLDWRMEQTCTLYYRRPQSRDQGEPHEEEEITEAVVIYTPLIGAISHPKQALPQTSESMLGTPPSGEEYIPFYHPKVRALAFHFYPPTPSSTTSEETIYGSLGISLIPFSPETTYPPTHRLSRVALSLITTLHMHTWGHLHSYVKRVHHDTVVPRALYQDLYLELKVKYASELIAGWKEATDPAKHVFEEMGIAAFLISLWSIKYKTEGERGDEWKGSVKFVDVGCGNGLLTHILTMEGFKGVGLDLRSRKSWPHYTSSSGALLEEWSFSPSSLIEPSQSQSAELWKGAWLLGNHADELTPWLPVLSTHYDAAGFINLPCCYFSLDGTKDFPLLKGGGGGEVSRNEQYLAYISELHTRFGWKLELEPLRIPSTKNWCFVGRQRVDVDGGEEELKRRVRGVVEQAMTRGWAARTK